MCSYDLSRVHPFPDFLYAIREGKDSDELYRNDGMVPIFSQWHPLSCQYVLLCGKGVKGGLIAIYLFI